MAMSDSRVRADQITQSGMVNWTAGSSEGGGSEADGSGGGTTNRDGSGGGGSDLGGGLGSGVCVGGGSGGGDSVVKALTALQPL